VAFTTLEESFKPTVMFFGLMNSSAMFQIMMNKVLWGLINTEKVVSFIDDMIVETETDKGYDKIVKKVVKRLIKNDLYIKPEKCKWKIKEVGFL